MALIYLFVLIITISFADVINIHIKLGDDLEKTVIGINKELKELDEYIDIEFEKKYQPHITLYMTDFENEFLPNLISTINQTSSRLLKGYVMQNSIQSVGNYAMWYSSLGKYIQLLSDTIVNNTFYYCKQGQPIPDWVLQIPDEEERKRKIRYIELYGSPNVFDEFEPHITIGFDYNSSRLETAVKKFDVSRQDQFRTDILALGMAGPHGTVLRGKDYAQFHLVQ
ncbi:MAG: hypothetical protein EZS28_007745 [Streblomastix strix]|uniref:Uncharacterized protein n=1 Tax=Streblomastix strix TaxID=222440 RepID=A0A5J4WQA0_9EUKA|nr:MAG: hypothetical protein EZS28_007745 [Streblomastix strix]